MPHGTTSVTRPGRWGNPYATAAEFRRAWEQLEKKDFPPWEPHYEHMKRMVETVNELAGFNLACWCDLGDDCHADFLLAKANSRKRSKRR